jgi:uncharacterized protein YoxC
MKTFEEIKESEIYSSVEDELNSNAEKIGNIGVAIQELNKRLERVLKPENNQVQDNEEKLLEVQASVIAKELRGHNRELEVIYTQVINTLERLDL